MKKLLRINASARSQASHSNDLGDYYVDLWKTHNPLGEVTVRNLAEDPVPHITNTVIDAFMQSDNLDSEHTALSDRLIDELNAADELLICSPLYNLSLPSPLKAYFDHVVRCGRTFDYHDNQCVGLLAGKTATLVTSRGGLSAPDVRDDFQTDYLQEILRFVGISTEQVVSLEGMAFADDEKQCYLDNARQQIRRYFDPLENTTWQGQFSSDDKQAIKALRDGQAMAIVKGDANAYADLCADDICLLIPGHQIIQGRDQFLVAENALFNSASFTSFNKYPALIQREGNRVMEMGYQQVSVNGNCNKVGVFSAQQKYLHSYQLTDFGWRYTMLMSNNCG